jgi:ankyrin repeat protein
MKQLLITIVALLFAGCSEQNKSFPQPLEKFWFQYNGPQETGFRYWERDGDGVWAETYPSGHQSIFKEEGRDSVDGLFGVYAVKLKGDIEKTGTQDGDFRVFIPDYQKKNSFIYLSYKSSGDWTNWRKTDYSINVLTTRDGKSYADMPKEIKSVVEVSQQEKSIANMPKISIHDAVIAGNVEEVKKLLANGVDLNKEDQFRGMTAPLHLAAASGHKEIVELLITDGGADVNLRLNINGQTALDGVHDKQVADLLRKHGAKTYEELNRSARTLIDAVEGEEIESLKKHLAEGIDVNIEDKDGDAPLHRAVLLGRKDFAELLISKGANVNAMSNIMLGQFNKRRYSLLDIAIQFDKTEIADLLIKHGAKTADWINADKFIHKAASAGHIEAVKKHLADGVNVNEMNVFENKTPLHSAVWSGRKEVVELLIAKGADVNLKASLGRTPLDQINLKLRASNFEEPLKEDRKKIFTEIADLLRKHGGRTSEELKK